MKRIWFLLFLLSDFILTAKIKANLIYSSAIEENFAQVIKIIKLDKYINISTTTSPQHPKSQNDNKQRRQIY